MIVPKLAWIVTDPAASVLASPILPPALLTTAIAMFEDPQFTIPVKSWVVPSLYVPKAVNCSIAPNGTVPEDGETAIETTVAVFTVRLADPVMLPSVAVIIVSPTPALVASPWVPGLLLITAAAAVDESQVAVDVRSCVEPSLKVPIAVNC
jgi:hypothetical protein